MHHLVLRSEAIVLPVSLLQEVFTCFLVRASQYRTENEVGNHLVVFLKPLDKLLVVL